MSSQSNASPVLIAAEQPLEAQALESMLSSTGYLDLRTTCDVREVVPLYAKWPYEILVLDMGLGQGMDRSMDPHCVLDVMASLKPSTQNHHLGILAITNEGDDRSLERALACGAADVITRPFTRAEVLMRITGTLTNVRRAVVHKGGADEAVMRAAQKRFSAVL
ncbi:response regulator [Pseudomonadota bacterium]